MSVSQTSLRHQPEQATTPKGSPPSRLLSSEAEQRIQQAGRDAIAGRPPVAAAKTYGGYKFVAVVIILGGVTGVVAGAVLSQPVLIVAGAIGAVVGLLLLIKASKAATKASTAHTAAVQQAAGEAARVRARQQEEAKVATEDANIARAAAEEAQREANLQRQTEAKNKAEEEARVKLQEEADRKAGEARIAEERAAKAIADAAEQARIAEEQRKTAETLELAAQEAQKELEKVEAETKAKANANAEADVGRSKDRSKSSSRSNSLTSGFQSSENLGETPQNLGSPANVNAPLSSPRLSSSIVPPSRSKSFNVVIPNSEADQITVNATNLNRAQTSGSATPTDPGLPPTAPQSSKNRRTSFTSNEVPLNPDGKTFDVSSRLKSQPESSLEVRRKSQDFSANNPKHDFRSTLRRASRSSQPSTPTASSDVATETSSTATTAGATSSETVFPVVKLNAVEPSARSDLKQGSSLLVKSPQLSGAIPIVTVEPKDTAAIVAPVQGVATPKAGDPVSSDGIVSTTPTTTTTTTATTTTTTIATTTTEAAPRAMLPARNTPASETPEPQKPINMVIRRVSDGGTLDTNRQEQASTGQIAAQASLFGPTVFDKKKTEGQ